MNRLKNICQMIKKQLKKGLYGDVKILAKEAKREKENHSTKD